MGRVHSATHKLNHGIANSTVLKLEHISANLSPGSKVVYQLKKEQDNNLWRQKYNKSAKRKHQRHQKRKRLFALYDKKHEDIGYSSCMLDANYMGTEFIAAVCTHKSKCKPQDCAVNMTENLHNYAQK